MSRPALSDGARVITGAVDLLAALETTLAELREFTEHLRDEVTPGGGLADA